jgi:hypothetical protein
VARKQEERVCGGGEGAVSEAQARPVVTLALEKLLFLNPRRLSRRAVRQCG